MNIRKKEKGFTIIEVVLVLAIAGLIFLMVFIALPALQRGQRDAQRKNDLSRLNTAITSYQSNNRGSLPTTWGSCTGTGATLVCTGFLKDYVTVGSDSFVDPSGTNYVLVANTVVPTIPNSFDATNPKVYITTGAICNGETVTIGQSSRKIAIQMKLEGSGTACQSN